MLTQSQLEKFCAKADHITPSGSDIKRPIRHEGYIYATDARICIRVVDDGTIEAVTPNGRLTGYDFARLFSGGENTNLPIPALPDRIECSHCNGTCRDHDCPSCDGEGVGIKKGGGTADCPKCSGSGKIKPDANAGACWWCNGRGEQEDNPVRIGSEYFNRVFLALAAEMPGARFVRISPYPIHSLIWFDGGEIAISPTRERKT